MLLERCVTDRADWTDYDIEDLVLAGRKVRKLIARTARERPYVLLGVAAGLGFIVGGGLRSRTGRALLATGVRFALPQLEQAAMAVVRSMASDGTNGATHYAEPADFVVGDD